MEKVDLTVSIEKMKLDALRYSLDEKGGDPPLKELEKRLKDLYEQTVASELRGYIDYMIAAQTPRSHSKKPASKPAAAPAPAPAAAEENKQGGNGT